MTQVELLREIDLEQLESFAQATHTPVGMLFLTEPPDEPVPIPDYRTMSGDVGVRAPSADLLEAIYLCQQRQIFTLAHELAHLWLGETALSNADVLQPSQMRVEAWCNRAAAEFLVPAAAIVDDFHASEPLADELQRLACRFKVSTLVVLRRLRDAGHLEWEGYRAAYEAELERIMETLETRSSAAGGGNLYNTQPARVSKRFARAVITSTLEGQTLRRDAMQMLGFKKSSTFEELAHWLGVA
jgi:Zn-dependent peptidase ImmA (M78 family)